MWGLYPCMGGAFCSDVDNNVVLIYIGVDMDTTVSELLLVGVLLAVVLLSGRV